MTRRAGTKATRRRTHLSAILVIIIVLAVVGVGVYFALESEPKAEFEVTSLTLSPTETKVGQTVTVSVAAKNTGDAAGTYRVVLTIDGAEIDAKEVTLAPGETKTVTFTIMKDTEGTFTIGADGLTESLNVNPLTPATFEVSNLVVNPSEAEVGEPVEISVAVKNIGDLEGGYAVELKIDGVVEATKDVTLAGGKSTTVIFVIRKEALKSYLVQVENLSQSFNVKPITELLSALLYPAIQIGGYVHQLGFGLFNGSSQTITVTGAEFFDKDGNIKHNISEADIARIWGSGDVKPSESFSGYVSFQIPYSIEEINGWWVKWYCLDASGDRFTVTGT